MPLFEPLVAEGILRKWLRGAPGHCSSLYNRFRGFSRRSRFLKLWGHRWVGLWNIRMHGSQLLLWVASQFFSKMLTYKRAYSGVKIIIVRPHPGPQSWYFLFSHRAQGKWESRFYALFKALIAFRFCTRIGPTEAHVLPCAPSRNNVRYRVIGVRKFASPKLYALPSRELLFSSCPHWHQFVVREAVYKWWKFQSVPSEN